MTVTSDFVADVDTGVYAGPAVLFERGDFYVTVVEVKDADLVEPSTRKAFALIHRPTGVRCALSSILSAIVRLAVVMDKDTRETLENPEASVEDSPPTGGFGGGSGFPGFA
jgi:hypothetical protein